MTKINIETCELFDCAKCICLRQCLGAHRSPDLGTLFLTYLLVLNDCSLFLKHFELVVKCKCLLFNCCLGS